MTTRIETLRPFILSLITLALAACTPQGAIGPDGMLEDLSEGPPGADAEDDHPAGPLHPDTVLVEEHPCFEYADVLVDDRSEIELVYSCDPANAELEPGQIVSGLDDGGYLRRIETVTLTSTSAFLTTSFASLAEAVTDVEFDESWDFSERRVVDFSGRTLDEVEVEGGNASVVVTRGLLNMNPRINASGRFGFLRLKSVTSRNHITLGLEMDVDYHSDGPVDRAQSVELESFDNPFTVRVGPVRVHGVLKSTVSLVFKNTSDGPIDVSTSFAANGAIDMGGTYTMPSTWTPHWNPSFEGTVAELAPEGDANWSGSVTVHVTGTVVLNGVEGGTSRYDLYSDGSTTSTCDGIAWATSGGVDAETVMKLRFMGRSVNHTFPDLVVEADRKEGTIEHDVPPAGCGGDDEFGTCAPSATLTCGGTVTADTSTDPAAVAGMDAYPCNVGNYDAPEMVYRWDATTSGPVEFKLIGAAPTEVNHDLFVLEGVDAACSAANCVAYGFNSVEFEPISGRTYYLVVDGFWDEAGAFEAQLDCG